MRNPPLDRDRLLSVSRDTGVGGYVLYSMMFHSVPTDTVRPSKVAQQSLAGLGCFAEFTLSQKFFAAPSLHSGLRLTRMTQGEGLAITKRKGAHPRIAD